MKCNCTSYCGENTNGGVCRHTKDDTYHEVILLGGPECGRVVKVNEKVAFLKMAGGHYGRVNGGGKYEFYWHEGDVPMAVSFHGRLYPVKHVERS